MNYQSSIKASRKNNSQSSVGLLRNSITVTVILLLFTLVSCRKFIEVEAPYTSLNASNVYASDLTAIAVLTDLYAEISAANNPRSNNPLQGSNIVSIPFFTGLSSDELTLFSINNTNYADYYRNDLTINTSQKFWNAIYAPIFRINSALEGLNASNSLTPSVKQQLTGEAYFMRAFCYFYLVNMYGDVPLVIDNQWKTNALMPKTSKADVYGQIVKDLKDAETLLSSNYLNGTLLNSTTERVRPSKWAASALLARVYLYTTEWAKAEEEASIVINNVSLFDTTSLNSVFLKNSKEAIWQLQPVDNANYSNTGEGKLFILPSAGPNASNYPVYLSNAIVTSFEAGDQRKMNWVDSVKPASIAYYYAKKYKIGDVNTSTQEYPTVLRLAEQYLIRAEARAQTGNVNGALTDLNVIRKRAGLANSSASGVSSILDAIMRERKVELFTEWGHRWFDLKRIGKIDEVMNIATPLKSNGTIMWRPYQALYPIPQIDIDRNPNLTQNASY